MQSLQSGMRLPVSSICVQIRHGAENTSEASASRIPRSCERTVSLTLATVRQDYSACVLRGSDIWHDSCL